MGVDWSIINENPITAVSALKYLGANGPHPNVIEVTEVVRAAYLCVIFETRRGISNASKHTGARQDAGDKLVWGGN